MLQRQGDVLIRKVDALPDGLKEVPRDAQGRIVLAEGEATGHFHAIDAPDAVFLAKDLADLEDRFLKIEAEHASTIDAWKCQGVNGACWVPAYVPTADVEATGLSILGREDVAGEVLTHDEHLPLVIPAGNYSVVRQREYTSDAERYVAD
jgi:hypothetical protein